MAEATSKADGVDEPGRPRGERELDPELMRLPKRRTKVGWLLSTAALAFSLYWMLALRKDLAYSRAGATPERVTVAALAETASDSFVSVALVPDRVHTARVWAGADLGVHAAPVLGSRGRVWLITSGSAYAGPPSYDNIYSGRVKRLGELPFFDDLVRYYKRGAAPLTPVDPSAFRDALGGAALVSSHGDPMKIAAGSRVELTWHPTGRAWIIVSAEPSGPADSIAWRAALESRAGLSIRGEVVADNPGRVPTWVFEVDAAAGLAPLRSALETSGLGAARVAPVEQIVSGGWGDIERTGDQVRLGETLLPLDEVAFVMVANPVTPDADAVALIEGELPGDFWYLTWLYVLFALVGAIFAWTLYAAVRGSVPPTVAA